MLGNDLLHELERGLAITDEDEHVPDDVGKGVSLGILHLELIVGVARFVPFLCWKIKILCMKPPVASPKNPNRKVQLLKSPIPGLGECSPAAKQPFVVE